MPPLPRIRTEALADLARQLRFTPRETVRRQLDRALELAGEIDPALEYPPEWVVFRVTGHRAELGLASPIAGRALLADLSAFCERLSHAAGIAAEDLPGAIGAGALAAHWSVSRKSLERYRRSGLIALRVRAENGQSRLVFPQQTLERFQARHRPRLDKARRFSRIPADVEARILRRASIYRRRFSCSLNQAAIRLSVRFERGLETVRQLLRRHDSTSAHPVFTEPPPLTPRQRRVAYRAWRLGIDPGDVARRYGHRRPAVRRVITDERAARLRALSLVPPAGSLPSLPEEDPAGEPAAPTDLHAFLERVRATPAADAIRERNTVGAYHALVARAAAVIASLPEHGASARVVDEAETLLRRAARIKAVLIGPQLPIVVRTLETAIGRPLDEVRSSVLVPMILEAVGAVAAVVDSFDPSRSKRAGRLAAPVGLAMTRVASRFAREHPADAASGSGVRARATPRLRPGVPVPDWTLRVAPWQPFVEPDARVRAGLGALDASACHLLEARFGWGGQPRTLTQIANARRTTAIKIAMQERAAIHAAIRATRLPKADPPQ